MFKVDLAMEYFVEYFNHNDALLQLCRNRINGEMVTDKQFADAIREALDVAVDETADEAQQADDEWDDAVDAAFESERQRRLDDGDF